MLKYTLLWILRREINLRGGEIPFWAILGFTVRLQGSIIHEKKFQIFSVLFTVHVQEYDW